jgi:hypothetical protein
MLDQEAYEHGKHTRDLEWFRPPERKTLRPLCVVLPELERASGTLESLCVLERTLECPHEPCVLACALSLL